jgi:hypothetical protein
MARRYLCALSSTDYRGPDARGSHTTARLETIIYYCCCARLRCTAIHATRLYQRPYVKGYHTRPNLQNILFRQGYGYPVYSIMADCGVAPRHSSAFAYIKRMWYIAIQLHDLPMHHAYAQWDSTNLWTKHVVLIRYFFSNYSSNLT